MSPLEPQLVSLVRVNVTHSFSFLGMIQCIPAGVFFNTGQYDPLLV